MPQKKSEDESSLEKKVFSNGKGEAGGKKQAVTPKPGTKRNIQATAKKTPARKCVTPARQGKNTARGKRQTISGTKRQKVVQEDDDEVEDDDDEDDDSEDDDSENDDSEDDDSDDVELKQESDEDKSDDDDEDLDDDDNEDSDDESDNEYQKEKKKLESMEAKPRKKKKIRPTNAEVKKEKEEKRQKDIPSVVSSTLGVKDQEWRRNLDNRSLFISNVPRDIPEEKLKNLSPDIIEVSRRVKLIRNRETVCNAIVRFKNEEIAEKNFKLLSKKKVDNRELKVDYMGEKSIHTNFIREKDEPVHPKRLYVSGFRDTFTTNELHRLFPNAKSVNFPELYNKRQGRHFGYGFVEYETSEEAEAARDKNQGRVVEGKTLSVMFARIKRPLRLRSKTETEPVEKKAKLDDKDDDK